MARFKLSSAQLIIPIRRGRERSPTSLKTRKTVVVLSTADSDVWLHNRRHFYNITRASLQHCQELRSGVDRQCSRLTNQQLNSDQGLTVCWGVVKLHAQNPAKT
jgi:hypothetical protein